METSLVLVLWISLTLVAYPLTPEESFSLPDYGSCGRFNLSLLGKSEAPSQLGLVAKNLHFFAPFNTPLPLIQIKRAIRTCESLSLSRNEYVTVTVLVWYTCTGIACGKASYEDGSSDVYMHLFSFACNSKNTYSTLDFFAQHPFVNRSTTNSGFTRSRPGSCTLCTVDPALQDHPNMSSKYYPVTGCLECPIQCLETGLRSCTTSVEGDTARNLCCFYRYREMCVHSCPTPYRIEPDTFECVIDLETPRITSLTPSHLGIANSAIQDAPVTYKIPLGFSNEVATCIAFGRPVPSIVWCRMCGSKNGFYLNSAREVGSYAIALLQFEKGFRVSDAGTYDCLNAETGLFRSIMLSVATAEESFTHGSNSMCVSTANKNAETFFEVRVLGTNCSTWSNIIRKEVSNDIQVMVTGAILSTCNTCPTSEGALVVSPPICSKFVDGATVFRGKIVTSQQNLTKMTYCILKFWLQLGPSVDIAGEWSRIDRGCIYELSSLHESKECMGFTPPLRVSLAGSVVSTAGIGVIFLICSAMIFYFLMRRYQKHVVSNRKKRVPAVHHEVDYNRYKNQMRPPRPTEDGFYSRSRGSAPQIPTMAGRLMPGEAEEHQLSQPEGSGVIWTTGSEENVTEYDEYEKYAEYKEDNKDQEYKKYNVGEASLGSESVSVHDDDVYGNEHSNASVHSPKMAHSDKRSDVKNKAPSSDAYHFAHGRSVHNQKAKQKYDDSHSGSNIQHSIDQKSQKHDRGSRHVSSDRKRRHGKGSDSKEPTRTTTTRRVLQAPHMAKPNTKSRSS